MPGTKLTSLDPPVNSIDSPGLLLYMVDTNDLLLDADGSGRKIEIDKNLVVTDGTNPVKITGGGTINLAGNTIDLDVAAGVSGDIVFTNGAQEIFDKTLTLPVIGVRDTELTLQDNTTPTKLANFDLSLLSEAAHVFKLPANDGDSTIVDDETAQTLTNKTLTAPVLNYPVTTVKDSELNIVDETNPAKAAKFQLSILTPGDHQFKLPDNAANSFDSTLIDHITVQTLTNKTLTTPVITLRNATSPTTEGDLTFSQTNEELRVGAGGKTIRIQNKLSTLSTLWYEGNVSSGTSWTYALNANCVAGWVNYEIVVPISSQYHTYSGCFAFGDDSGANALRAALGFSTSLIPIVTLDYDHGNNRLLLDTSASYVLTYARFHVVQLIEE